MKFYSPKYLNRIVDPRLRGVDCKSTPTALNMMNAYLEELGLHRNSTIEHIGNIAMILGRKVHWNLQKEEFVNDHEANAMRSRPERDPWKLKDLVV